MEYLLIFLTVFFFSTCLFIFWVSKGGFNKKFLYTDNTKLILIGSLISVPLYEFVEINLWLLIIIIIPSLVFICFLILFFYRFFRNPKRQITARRNEIVSPADGRVIYIKEIEANQIPVSVKKKKLAQQDIKHAMEKIVKGASMEEAIQFEKVDTGEVENEIRNIIKGKPGLNPNAYMGLVMKEFKGKVDGKTAMQIIQKYAK